MSSIAHVGMDVHKDTTRVLLLGIQGPLPLDAVTVPTEEAALLKYLRPWRARYELHCYYEAGTLGYVVYRWLQRAGIACTVVAPSKIPRAPGDRVKTDQRDARTLALQGRAGTLAAVRVPTPAEEAVRGLVRCRGAHQRDVQAARHRVLKFLALRGEMYRAGKHWTQLHRRWLAARRFAGPDAWTYQEYLSELSYREQRLAEADREVEALAAAEPYATLVRALCCFRGISTLSAMILVTEALDFGRFGRPPAYMSYLGLTCREASSGSRRRQGSITKAGSGRCRHVLVEAAWHYRHPPAVGACLSRRQAGQPAAVIAHAWKAQQRLHKLFQRLTRTGDRRRAVVAVARELAGFLWAAAQLVAAPGV